MTSTRIIAGLDALEYTGSRAEDAAKQGFLEWALSIDPAQAVEAAKSEIHRLKGKGPFSPAARIFLNYLAEATHAAPRPSTRRGGAAGRRSVLH